MIEYNELNNLSHEELIEEYCKLYDRFQELRECNEMDTQKIHELKRSLDTATAAQRYLSQELEQYANSDDNKIEHELHKTVGELEEVKRKYSQLEATFLNLQHDFNLLSEENSNINKNFQEVLKYKEQHSCEENTKQDDEYLLRIQELENENMALVEKIYYLEDAGIQYTLTIVECEKNIEILRDQVMCLEENLKSKREDLEEKLQILESTQEQLAEANSKISMLSKDPDNNDRKGNSLFAEVDDQRQAMKQLLTAQNKHYIEMKKFYNESEQEIRRLKRENISMLNELETCSNIFCNADKIYEEKLNERVRNLLNQNEELEHKLTWTQEKLKNLAPDKGVLFLDTVLDFCKKETDDLKIQLRSARIQNASLEEQLRNSQQDMARWRFESLKSRCILSNREHLLTEHKITFNPSHAVEYNISKKDQEEAKPRIFNKRRSSLIDNIMHRKSITPSTKSEIASPPTTNLMKDNEIQNAVNVKNDQKETLNTSIKSPSDKNESANAELHSANTKIIELDESLQLTKKEPLNTNMTSTPETDEVANKELKSAISNAVELDARLSMSKIEEQNNHEDKENKNHLNDIPILNNFSKLRVTPSPMRPSQRSLEKTSWTTSAPSSRSILYKQNDLLFKDSNKNVRFSAEEDTVHNLSADSTSSCAKSSTTSRHDNSSTNKLNSKDTGKQSRSKSSVIVRRVVINSKHD